ncbi:hypothetical protein [Thermodesulfovibrio sp. TK110]
MKIFISYQEMLQKNINVFDFIKVVEMIGYDVRVANNGLVVATTVKKFQNKEIVFWEMKNDIETLMNYF